MCRKPHMNYAAMSRGTFLGCCPNFLRLAGWHGGQHSMTGGDREVECRRTFQVDVLSRAMASCPEGRQRPSFTAAFNHPQFRRHCLTANKHIMPFATPPSAPGARSSALH